VVNGWSNNTVMLLLSDEYSEIFPEPPTVVRLIAYAMIIPFRISGNGGSQEIVTEVELTGVALTLVGCPVGTEEKYQRRTSHHLQAMCHSFDLP